MNKCFECGAVLVLYINVLCIMQHWNQQIYKYLQLGNLWYGVPMQVCLVWFGFKVLNPTFKNISAISWRSVLLLEETGVPGENHRPVASYQQTLSQDVVSSTPRLSGVRTHNLSGDMQRRNQDLISSEASPWGSEDCPGPHQIQGRALVWSWEQSPNEAPALYETVRVFLAMKMIGKMYLKWLFQESCNIRVIPGTHHARNRTLTITFRCYVIIVFYFMSAII